MPVPINIRTAVFIRDKWRCRCCGWRNDLHPHHIIFKSHSGMDTVGNLISLCRSCHIDGIHGGRLIIHLTGEDANDIVEFERVRGWKPQ